MHKELICFLNFNFIQRQSAIKTIDNDEVKQEQRWVLNWPEYIMELEKLNIEYNIIDRPYFERYKQSKTDKTFFEDFIVFQAALQQQLVKIIKSKKIYKDFLNNLLKETSKLPTQIEILNIDNIEEIINIEKFMEIKFTKSFITETYRIYLLTLLRELIYTKKIFNIKILNNKFIYEDFNSFKETIKQATPTKIVNKTTNFFENKKTIIDLKEDLKKRIEIFRKKKNSADSNHRRTILKNIKNKLRNNIDNLNAEKEIDTSTGVNNVEFLLENRIIENNIIFPENKIAENLQNKEKEFTFADIKIKDELDNDLTNNTKEKKDATLKSNKEYLLRKIKNNKTNKKQKLILPQKSSEFFLLTFEYKI